MRKLCGVHWLRSQASKNNMFEGSSGLISRTVCTSAHTPLTNQSPHQYLSRRPISERELIGRTPISTPVSTQSITSTIDGTMTCPRCGTFRKSGRVSCCAPGGAWFKNCGGLGSKNVDHRWSEGVKACKPTTTTTIRPECRKCGTISKSGKSSCCGRGGSWFRNCGSAGNAKLSHTWYEGIQVCKTRSQSKRARDRQSNAAQRLNSSNGIDKGNSKTVMATAKSFAFTPANTSTPIPFRPSSITPANAFMNKATAMPDEDTSTQYGTGKANFKTITITSTSMTSTTTSMTAAAHNSTLTTTTTNTITDNIETK